jgi:hypothetical protein
MKANHFLVILYSYTNVIILNHVHGSFIKGSNIYNLALFLTVLQKSLCKASEYDLNLYVISFGQAQLVT